METKDRISYYVGENSAYLQCLSSLVLQIPPIPKVTQGSTVSPAPFSEIVSYI